MNTNALRDPYGCFSKLLTLAEEYLSKGDLVAATGVARTAVHFVFQTKCLFASPRLERLLVEIGMGLPVAPPFTLERDAGSRKVLHVLTHARPIGGDSRFVWRWIQNDPASQHFVAVTTQDSVAHLHGIPQPLVEAVSRSGGFIHPLESPGSSPLAQAQELRGLCRAMDVVALHLYPYDIIPALALAKGCEDVKTLFINHADHGFWTGAGVAHTIVHLRRQSPVFLRDRRGLDPSRSSLLPIPLTPVRSKLSRAEAKRELGYPPDKLLLLTIATPFKYSAPGQTGFLELVLPVLEKFPETLLVAIGPEPNGAWQRASAATGGRIIAHGTRWDTELFYSAADIYLDSVPFSSITSLLEAGSRGVPLLGFNMPDPDLELLGPGAPGLDGAMEIARGPDSYRDSLARLITDQAFRHDAGERVRAQIAALHTGSGWTQALNETYLAANRAVGRKCLAASGELSQSSALNRALFSLYSGVPASMRKVVRESLGSLPYPLRARVSLRLRLIGLDLSLLNLLPSPFDRWLHGAGRWGKRRLLRAVTQATQRAMGIFSKRDAAESRDPLPPRCAPLS